LIQLVRLGLLVRLGSRVRGHFALGKFCVVADEVVVLEVVYLGV
jgi:hypothetical protein